MRWGRWAPWLSVVVLGVLFAAYPATAAPGDEAPSAAAKKGKGKGKGKGNGRGKAKGAKMPGAIRLGAAQRDVDVLISESLLGQQPYRAVAQASACLEAKPNQIGCRSVVFRGLVRVRHCSRVEEHVPALRASSVWDDEHAVLEGVCAMRRGELARAEAIFEEADAISGRAALPLYELGVVRLRQGDLDGARAAYRRLEQAKDPDGMLASLGAMIALAAGDPHVDEAIDGALHRFKNDPERIPAVAQLLELSCQRWLDLGDPYSAAQAGAASRDLHFREDSNAACMAEAYRRQGDGPGTDEVVERPWFSDRPSYAVAAVRALHRIDQGDLAAARAELPGLEHNLEAYWRVRWYLARAEGDAASMEQAEQAWDAVVHADGRTLQQLIPEPSRAR